MSGPAKIEHGRTGRILYARIRPNEDLVSAVEKICLREGLTRGFLRGSLGSLTDATLAQPSGREDFLEGPAVEVVSLSGEVRPDAAGNPVANLSGVVLDPAGRVSAGRFVRGQNPVCVTFELTLEEWLVDEEHALSGAGR